MIKFAWIIFFLTVKKSDAFKIVSNSQNGEDLQQGSNVTLSCKTDDYWEYCDWKHKSRDCKFEWKYSKDAVVRQTCHDDISGRITLVGDYKNHECSIHIRNLFLEDAGEWTCQLESYVWGSTRGYVRSKSVKVEINVPGTTSTTADSSSEIVKKTVSTTPTTTSSTSTTTVTTTTMTTTTTPIPTTTVTTTTTTTIEATDVDENKDEIDELKDDNVTALPVLDKEASEETSVGLIAGVVVALVAMSLILVVVGITWHRRRKSHLAIISYLQTERDDAMAANSFLEEAEYHISIIRDPQSLPLQQKQTIENAVSATDSAMSQNLDP